MKMEYTRGAIIVYLCDVDTYGATQTDRSIHSLLWEGRDNGTVPISSRLYAEFVYFQLREGRPRIILAPSTAAATAAVL